MEAFECPLCCDLLNEVVEAPCCHACYCFLCVKKWVEKSGTCPGCRTNANLEIFKPNLPLQRIVDNFSISCPNKGCTDKITRGILNDHLKNCEFGSVRCPFSEMCREPPLKKDLKKHNESCEYRPTECQNCQIKYPLKDVENHLQNDCPKAMVSCPLCKSSLFRCELQKHAEAICLERQIHCSYSVHGCEFQCKAVEMENHLKEFQGAHLELVNKALQTQLEANSLLLNKISSLEKELGKYESLLQLKPNLPYSPFNKGPCMLPSQLQPIESNIVVFENSFTVTYKGTLFRSASSNPFMIRSNYSIPDVNGIYYFEINVVNAGTEGIVGIGLCPMNYKLEAMPGWYCGYGYHSDDGNKFEPANLGKGKTYGPLFTTGDTIGLGYDRINRVIFFTKNGQHLGNAFENVPNQNWYPAIGLHSIGAKVLINFGQNEFVYKKI